MGSRYFICFVNKGLGAGRDVASILVDSGEVCSFVLSSLSFDLLLGNMLVVCTVVVLMKCKFNAKHVLVLCVVVLGTSGVDVIRGMCARDW